jgi:hypothetical protein
MSKKKEKLIKFKPLILGIIFLIFFSSGILINSFQNKNEDHLVNNNLEKPQKIIKENREIKEENQNIKELELKDLENIEQEIETKEVDKNLNINKQTENQPEKIENLEIKKEQEKSQTQAPNISTPTIETENEGGNLFNRGSYEDYAGSII